MNELYILLDTGYVVLKNNIGENAKELKEIYQESLPYDMIDTIDGTCILWNESFIDKCIIAMSTGSLNDFSDMEKQIWNSFVEYQDALSYGADATIVDAIGCTTQNENGESFVVLKDGTITAELCMKPESSVAKERQSKSLDEYLMNILNCKEPNSCGIIDGDVIDLTPCKL